MLVRSGQEEVSGKGTVMAVTGKELLKVPWSKRGADSIAGVATLRKRKFVITIWGGKSLDDVTYPRTKSKKK